MKPREIFMRLLCAPAPSGAKPHGRYPAYAARPTRPGLRGPVKLSKAAVFPRTDGKDESHAIAAFPGGSVTFDNFHTLPGCVPQYALELRKGLVGYGAAVEEELLIRAGKMTREELSLHLLVDVLLHRAVYAPGEAPADQQTRAIAWLQHDDLQPIELDEVLQQLPVSEAIMPNDLIELCAVLHLPGYEEQPWVRDDFLLLGEGELVDRRSAILRTLEDFVQRRAHELTDAVDPLQGEIAS